MVCQISSSALFLSLEPGIQKKVVGRCGWMTKPALSSSFQLHNLLCGVEIRESAL